VGFFVFGVVFAGGGLFLGLLGGGGYT
jgi:hypothetical protein